MLRQTVKLGGLAALLAFGGNAPAQEAKTKPLPPGVAACDFGALANDSSPGGLNIRAEPNANSAILGRLPMIENLYHEKIAADVHVIGVKQGWFLIEGAVYDPLYDLPRKIPRAYGGRGWVSGKLLTTGLRWRFLKVGPDDNAGDVAELQGGDDAEPGFGPSEIDVKAILDCKGEWFRIEAPVKTEAYTLKPKLPSDGPTDTVRGWTHGYCTNQRTTCV